MCRLSQYLKSGSGRGLRLVLLVTFLMSAFFGWLTWYTGREFSQHPVIVEFVDSIPVLTIKDGIVEEKDVQWKSFIPLTRIPVTVDTSMENLALPAPDGIYLTNRFMYLVSEHGTQSDRSAYANDVTISPDYVRDMLQRLVWSFALGMALFVFIVAWIGYLLTVALSALLGFLFRVGLGAGRVWRISAVTWSIGLIVVVGLALLGYIFSMWHVCWICILLNTIVLFRLKD